MKKHTRYLAYRVVVSHRALAREEGRGCLTVALVVMTKLLPVRKLRSHRSSNRAALVPVYGVGKYTSVFTSQGLSQGWHCRVLI